MSAVAEGEETVTNVGFSFLNIPLFTHCRTVISVLTLIASSGQDEADRAVFLLLVLRVWWEGLGAVVEGGGVLVAGANHGAGVPHGRSWGLVLDLPIIRHLQLGCSRPLLHKNINHKEGRVRKNQPITGDHLEDSDSFKGFSLCPKNRLICKFRLY